MLILLHDCDWITKANIVVHVNDYVADMYFSIEYNILCSLYLYNV